MKNKVKEKSIIDNEYLEEIDKLEKLAIDAYKNKNYKEAFKQFDNFFKVIPDEVEKYKDSTDKYNESKVPNEEILPFDKATIWFLNKLIAMYYINMNNIDEAKIYIEKAKYQDPEDFELDKYMGFYYLKKDCYDIAIKEFKEAIKKNKKVIKKNKEDYESHRLLGLCYCFKEDYDQAIKELDNAIHIKQDDSISYIILAICKFVQGKFKDALCKFRKVPLDNYENISDLVLKYIVEIDSKIEKNQNISAYLLELYRKVMIQKGNLLIDLEKNTQVVHYSKLNTINYLVKKDVESKLRINNVEYMNDPLEGNVFLEMFKKYYNENKRDNQQQKDSGELTKILYEEDDDLSITTSDTYLASFSMSKDTLPMWTQYGQDGNGCCFILDSKSFFDKKENLDSEIIKSLKNIGVEQDEIKVEKYCLYEVKYIDRDNLDNVDYKELFETIIRFDTIIDDIKSLGEELSKKIFDLIRSILDQIRFLFKDSSYSHEKEVRIIKFASKDSKDIKLTEANEGFRVPRLFIELDRPLKYKEIILGPKVNNITEIATYLHYTGKVNEVKKSKIKYR